MTLRARLLLGYGYLVGLLLFTAGSATLSFLHLSAGIEVVLDENFRSIRSAMAMIEALERQDSATLAALIEGQHEIVDMASHEESFRDALEEAAGNVTEEDEPETLAAIRQHYAAYREARSALFAELPERPLTAYNQQVFPRFSEVKHDVIRLLDINQRAMFRADRQARETAVQSSTWLGFMVVVALVSLVFLSRAMQRRILSRLARLRSGMFAISTDLQGRLREEGNDELAMIARHLNRLLDQNEELKARNQGRVAEERRLVLGLLGACGEGAALFTLSGDLVAGTVEDRSVEGVVSDWIQGAGRRHAEAARPLAKRIETEDGAGAIEVELLLAPGERPVGWIARPV